MAELTRRFLLAAPLACAALGRTAAASPSLAAQLAQLEHRSRGRLGVAILETGSGRAVGMRIDERFSFCSTIKVLLAGMVLSRVDSGALSLAQKVTYDLAHLPAYTPITGQHRTMTLDEICAAAMVWSDNGAANLLFDQLGGPAALTGWLRSIGDATTLSSREETALNDLKPGTPDDTTTPRAMAMTLKTLLLGNALSAASRQQLSDWMIDCRTGMGRLRAGLPATWRTGDRTGTGNGTLGGGQFNDVAIGYPPDRPPLIVTAWLDTPLDKGGAEAIFAEIGRIAASVAF